MRLSVAVAVSCLFLASLSAAELATAAIKKQTNISPQSLGAALHELAKDRELQVLYRTEVVGDRHTSGAVGELTFDEALTQLLHGSNLTFQYLDDKTVTILPVAQASGLSPQASSFRSEPRGFWNRLRLAQSDSPSTPQADSNKGDPFSVERFEEVVVTGTHIRGVDNLTVPLIVMDREYIESTGMTTAIQLIESLPQNFSLVNQSAAGGVLSGNSLAHIQGSTINLRGMGEGTTLTLVNGRRMPLSYDGSAVNIAALPLSAIERVDVLTDGASALYGSDAVGGVVNFVLRRNFEGAETNARVGFADDVDEHRVSQVIGRSWTSGNVVFTAEHYRRDMLQSQDRNFGIGGTTAVGTLLPKDSNIAATLFANQELSSNVDMFLDLIYTDRNSFNRSLEESPFASPDVDVDNLQLSASTGLGWDFGSAWRAELALNHGRDELDVHIVDPPSFFRISGDVPTRYKSTSVDLKADGPLFDLPGGAVRIAVGGQYRDESHDYRESSVAPDGTATNVFAFHRTREVASLFSEASVPIVGANNAVQGVQRLDLSLAVRYDDYSDFGSSVDPRVGLAWSPVEGLKLRGSWGTSYLAPKLKDFDLSLNGAIAIENFFGANGLTIMQVAGNAPEALKAQESTNYSFGLDWKPAFLPGASFSVNYYDIDYKDRIETIVLSFDTVLNDPDSYGALLILDPTVEQVNEYIAHGERGRPFVAFTSSFQPIIPSSNFDRSTVDAIFDFRRRNIGVLKTNGFDVSAAYDFQVGDASVHLALDGAYIFELFKQITTTSTPFDTVDTTSNPTHFKARASLGYRKGGWSVNGFVHRKNSYTDTRFPPSTPVDSYVTVDANVGYRFDNSAGLLSGTSITFGAINMLDRDPPGLRVRPGIQAYDMGFDPANASPLGRLLTIDVTKRW